MQQEEVVLGDDRAEALETVLVEAKRDARHSGSPVRVTLCQGPPACDGDRGPCALCDTFIVQPDGDVEGQNPTRQ